ncbi:MAG: FtsX-like permease family protein [Aerococcus sp.]|nr:FtsX-like permease family protein [Aerococcus sp.]
MNNQGHQTLWKDAWREILHSKARFSALIGIIILGTGFFVGMRSAAPDMRMSANRYYHDYQLADIMVNANYGLSNEEEQLLTAIPGLQVRSYQSMDVEETTKHQLFKLYPNFNATDSPNQFRVISGHLPKKGNEIALDRELMTGAKNKQGYVIGDTIELATATDTSQDRPKLKNKQYIVVGFVSTPQYIDRTASRGYTSLGKGTLDGFAVVMPDQFSGGEPTGFAIKVDEVKDLAYYSKDYAERIDQKIADIENKLQPREEVVYQKMKKELDDGIKQTTSELEEGELALKQGQQAIDQAKRTYHEQWQAYQNQLKATWKQYPTGKAPTALAEPLIQANEQLKKAKQQLDNQEAAFNQKKKDTEGELAQGKETLAHLKQQRAQLPSPNYQVTTPIETGGVKTYGDNADRISAIAAVFPWVFFLVATLVSFTTMTRMVDDERTRMGTLKALGYRNGEIALKFVLYALSACLIGATIGIGVGTYLFPAIIYRGYQEMYELPDIHYQFYSGEILLTVSIALLTTVGPALWTLRHSLRANAATLMRPKPPKRGQHIFLERWTWLWRKLNFMMKITLRNLFRYKGRNLMTVIGILGCTALMITGFGISDSIKGLPEKQFSELETNDALITLLTPATTAQVNQALTSVKQSEIVDDALPLSVMNYRVDTPSAGEQTVNVRIFDAKAPYAAYYRLLDVTTHQPQKLPTDGVLISNKLAQLLNLKVGEAIELTDDTAKPIKLPVKGIVESYLQHDVFLSRAVYQQWVGEVPTPNTIFVHLNDQSPKKTTQLAEELTARDEIVNVTYTKTLQNAFDDTLTILASVTVVLIIAAAALAFIVLYSLQNINVSERLQELSTIKVLGAYAEEVTLYIYRETLILTGVGIALGLAVGYALTRFILKTVEVDIMIFPTHISVWSYVWAGGLSFLFSAIVMVIMHRRLRHVDMVEALKGVE